MGELGGSGQGSRGQRSGGRRQGEGWGRGHHDGTRIHNRVIVEFRGHDSWGGGGEDGGGVTGRGPRGHLENTALWGGGELSWNTTEDI